LNNTSHNEKHIFEILDSFLGQRKTEKKKKKNMKMGELVAKCNCVVLVEREKKINCLMKMKLS
jgi:hypothetical protein